MSSSPLPASTGVEQLCEPASTISHADRLPHFQGMLHKKYVVKEVSIGSVGSRPTGAGCARPTGFTQWTAGVADYEACSAYAGVRTSCKRALAVIISV